MERVRALGHGSPRSKTQIVGDRFFVDESLPWDVILMPVAVMTGLIDSTDPPVRILERVTRTWPIDQLWIGTSSALYWSDGQKIYKRGLP